MYRVISADGRESDTQHENDYLYTDAPAPGTPNAGNVRAYTRNYVFNNYETYLVYQKDQPPHLFSPGIDQL